MKNRIVKLLALFLAISLANASLVQLSELTELNEDNWRSMLDGEWMVEFFAPWCPACKNLAPTWEKFAKAAGDHGVYVAKIDVTKSPSLSGRFFVTALPTIYHVFNGEFRQYRGSRDADSFLLYIKQSQWRKVDPISAWKQPDSIHMSILSYFFKLSHYLKDFNARLHEEYGLPTWGSYALFAIATIFVGALLGLVLVCIVDFLYPPKKSHRQSFSESKEKAYNNAVEEIFNDELEDDAPQEEDEDEEEEAENDAEDDSTSDAEKNSDESDSDDELFKNDDDDDIKDENVSNDPEESSKAAEVRKRKPRKAD